MWDAYPTVFYRNRTMYGGHQEDEVRVPRVGEHVRGGTSDVPQGTYRVVGVDEAVTLLRVTDTNDRRVYSGSVVRVSLDELAQAFEPAANPDSGFTPGRTVRNGWQGVYWSVRRFF